MVGLEKEIEDCARRVLHYQVGASIAQLAKVVNGQDIGMLQVGDALGLVKEAVASLLRELLDAQHFEGQNTTERSRLAHLIDMTIAAGADKSDHLVIANARPLHQKITAPACDGLRRILVRAAHAWIQTMSQLNPTSNDGSSINIYAMNSVELRTVARQYHSMRPEGRAQGRTWLHPAGLCPAHVCVAVHQAHQRAPARLPIDDADGRGIEEDAEGGRERRVERGGEQDLDRPHV